MSLGRFRAERQENMPPNLGSPRKWNDFVSKCIKPLIAYSQSGGQIRTQDFTDPYLMPILQKTGATTEVAGFVVFCRVF
jgi:hypothetical protein